MPAADLLRFVASRQVFEAIIADRRQHGVACFSVGGLLEAQQAMVDQGRQPLQHVDFRPRLGADGLCRLGAEAFHEYRQASEQLLLVCVEQVIAPGERATECLLARREVGRARLE